MTNELSVCVQIPGIPAPSWNKDEVQKNIDEMLAAYTGRVYTPEDIKGAKTDRAAINALDKTLGEKASATKDFYLKPLEEFQTEIKKMRDQCKKVSGAIDAQVKAVEQAEKDEKAAALQLVYQDCIGELEPLLSFERLLDHRWLNKTFALSQAEKALRQAVENVRSDLAFLRETCGQDVEACTTEYLRDFSVNAAVREHNHREESRERQRQSEAARLAAEKARAAAPVIVPPTEEERERKLQAQQNTHASAFITADGRLDCEVLQKFAEPVASESKRYRFWVEFTEDDIKWFKQGAKERGFRYGSIK